MYGKFPYFCLVVFKVVCCKFSVCEKRLKIFLMKVPFLASMIVLVSHKLLRNKNQLSSRQACSSSTTTTEKMWNFKFSKWKSTILKLRQIVVTIHLVLMDCDQISFSWLVLFLYMLMTLKTSTQDMETF